MSTYKSKGIILKRSNFSEADRIVTVFTATIGKIRAVAKGVRRTMSKLSGNLELFTHSNLVFAKGRNIDLIVGSDTIDSFNNLRSDLSKTSIAYYIAELTDKLTPDEHKDTRIYELLVKTFRRINQDKFPISNFQFSMVLITRFFEVKLMNYLGYSPELYKCVHCNKKIDSNSNYFSSFLGGILCKNCRNYDKRAIRISTDAIKILRFLQKNDLDNVKINRKALREIEEVLRDFIVFILEKELKSTEFIKKISIL